MKDTYTTDNVAEMLIFYLFSAKKRKETTVNYFYLLSNEIKGKSITNCISSNISLMSSSTSL